MEHKQCFQEEHVIAGFTKHAENADIMVNFKVVIPAAAKEVCVKADPWCCAVHSIDDINQRIFVVDANGVQDTPNKEIVVAPVAVDLHRGHAVIGNERVISIATANFHNFCSEIIINPLERSRFAERNRWFYGCGCIRDVHRRRNVLCIHRCIAP